MRISESQLRRVIREVISEAEDLVAGQEGFPLNKSDQDEYFGRQDKQGHISPSEMKDVIHTFRIHATTHFLKTPAGKSYLNNILSKVDTDEELCKEIVMSPRCTENDRAIIKKLASNPHHISGGVPDFLEM
jgi:hypothetical protein